MGTRKTLIIMVTVVGCIAILWPKVFYPMVVGPNGGGGAGVGVGGQFKPNIMKDHRGSGCCDVVLDQEKFANASINAANQHDLFRKRNVGPAVEDGSIRQERPPHLRPETIHPAMRERGRAIPHVGSVHSERPVTPPRIVEGRPGPIPGMRPPMGAGSHQSTKSVNSMGFIMPLYTIGIVSFFIYTILKLLFKKNPATPYPEIKPDTTFREEVFTQDQYIKRPVESGKTKLVVTAIQGLISAADEQLLKIDRIKQSAANNLSKETEETDNTEPAEKETPARATEAANGHVVKHVDDVTSNTTSKTEPEPEVSLKQESQEVVAAEEPEVAPKVVKKREAGAVPKKKRQTSSSSNSNTATVSGQEEEGRGLSKSGSTVKVIPMEKKAAYEPGQHAADNRPTSPVQSVTLDSSIVECDAAESKCVLLETKVPQSSKVLVANSDHSVEKLDTTATATATSARTEGDTPFDLNLIVVFESVSNLNQGRSLEVNVLLGSEPTTTTTTTVVNSSGAAGSTVTRVASPTREVVLSGKMKLSLVKLDDIENKSSDDVVVKAKDGSQDKKPSRFGPNEE
uniref:Resistance to inhibitors of cholinesterase protein 3 N-terminal domain-containing protein n=1 Tax=Culex tarsalis TaxID=7177 RepID=A0A1Q3FNB2_CULTA